MEPAIIAKITDNKTYKLTLETPLPFFVPLSVGEKRDLIHFSFYPDDQKYNPMLQTDTFKVTRKALINGQEGYEVSGHKSKQYIIPHPDSYRIEVESYVRPNDEIWVTAGSDHRYPRELSIDKTYEHHERKFKLMGDCELIVDGNTFSCILITFLSPNTLINYYVNKNGEALLKMNYHSKGHNMYDKGSFKRGIIFEERHYSLLYFTMLNLLIS